MCNDHIKFDTLNIIPYISNMKKEYMEDLLKKYLQK